MNCPKCKITLVEASRKVTDSKVQNVQFCPKCNYEILGEVTDGAMEIEDEKSLILISQEINSSQISWLRKLNLNLNNMSLSELRNKLSKGILLKDLTYEEFTSIYLQAQDLKIETKEIEQ